MNCAETIREITRKHLVENNGVALGQCLSAVGWVGGTVPELTNHPNLIELSMDDTSGGYRAVGLALAGRRPIFVCRYQGFMWFNAPPFTNYAAKAKEIWGYKVPIFIRAIAMEGAIGPVAGSSHHGMITRMPGIKVIAPMTPNEYTAAWTYFMSSNEPFYISEHRRSFAIDHEMKDIVCNNPDITLFAISASRLNAVEAVRSLKDSGINCNLMHLVTLKPFLATEVMLNSLSNSRHGGIVVDTDYENGVSKCIAHDLMMATNSKVRVLGLEEKTAGFAPHLDNLPPSPKKIADKVREIVSGDRP